MKRELIETRRYLTLRNGGNERTETAVAAGLEWLAAQQKQDGRWVIVGGQHNDTAATAFALLPFLAAGQVHVGPLARPPYDVRVKRGLEFLVTHQNSDGNLGGGMYGHALSTMALSHAFALTADPKLKDPAQKAVDYIVRAQHTAGGWRYTPGTPGDTSVTAWQVAALHVARHAGLAVPRKTIILAHAFLDQCETPDGAYGYLMPRATATMTAAGLVTRSNLGWGSHQARLRSGIHALAKMDPGGAGKTYYHQYWATQAFHHAGGAEWEKWNTGMRTLVLAGQEAGPGENKGSWSPVGAQFDAAGGRLMVTSLALLTLEVYYRNELAYAFGPARLVTNEEVAQAWSELGAADEVIARRAVWALANSAKSLPLLRDQLPPRPPPDLDQAAVARLIADLDSDNFAKREQASAALGKLGPSIEVLLRNARVKTKSAEARRRLGELLAQIEAPRGVPETVRLGRAVEVLEYAGTPEAVRFLRELATKEPDTDLARAAKAAVERLDAR
jgi:hypothetical protein